MGGSYRQWSLSFRSRASPLQEETHPAHHSKVSPPHPPQRLSGLESLSCWTTLSRLCPTSPAALRPILYRLPVYFTLICNDLAPLPFSVLCTTISGCHLIILPPLRNYNSIFQVNWLALNYSFTHCTLINLWNSVPQGRIESSSA